MEEKGHKKDVWDELKSFKRKFYFNQIVKGGLLLLGILVSIYLVINTLEFSFRFGKIVRTTLFAIFILSAGGTFVYFILDPLLKLIGKRPGLTDEDAAYRIGNAFPTIKDRLVNLIQLKRSGESNDLVQAGIYQKSKQVSNVSFKSSIRLGENKKYLKYVLSPVSLALIIGLAYPSFFSDSTERIIKFNRDFVPEAPFQFETVFDTIAFKNEDFTMEMRLEGSAYPESAYLLNSGRKVKLIPLGDGVFQHTFKKLQEGRKVRVEAAGFFSPEINIKVVERPSLRNFNVQLSYPRYTGRTNERLSNIGNLQVPEGTRIQWQFATNESDTVNALFLSDSSVISAAETSAGLFEIDKKFYDSDNYLLRLYNNYSQNKDPIRYSISVEKDEYPEIKLSLYQDTILYSVVALGGNLSDDYGLTQLKVHYSVTDPKGREGTVSSFGIPINSGQPNQGFYYQWAIDSLGLKAGDKLSYYIEVWDNDAINGRKSSKTGRYQFVIPSRKEIKDEIAKNTDKTENKLEQSLQDAQDLDDKIKEAEAKIKGKKDLNWEDEKLLKEILDKKEEVDKAIEELKEMNRNMNKQRNRFSPQDQKMQEKSKQLQQLMDDLMDEKTREMFEELQKLLEDRAGVEQIQQLMEQMSRRNKNLKKELARSLELFKRLKLDQELNDAAAEVEALSKAQEELAEETMDESSKAEDLLKEQQDLQERFDEVKKNLDSIDKLNQELDDPKSLEDQSGLQKSIEQDQKDSEKELESMTEKQKSEENQASKEEGDKNLEENQESKEGESKEESQKGEESKGEEESGEQKEGEQKESSESEEGAQEESKQEQESSSEQNDSQDKEQQQRSKASQSQRNAAQKMKQMGKKLQQMQEGAEMEMLQENIDDLRNIVHNLLKLSFDQENLMENFRGVNESDPGFIPLSQEQLKLKDDSRIIEDSLNSLAERVFQIKSFITREVSAMNEHMDNSMDALKERKKYRAVSEQQFAMTSMNNLALLLDDVLDNMMNSMAESSGKSKSKGQQKKPSLGEMQQMLNGQIEQLKESGKTGRELSEELAKLAAEQARIRKALQEMQKRMEEMNTEQNGKAPGSGLTQKMEQTEIELVNKQLTEMMIRRQQDIVTRLLEAENAMRERELDEERKGETAKEYDKIIPKAFDEYLKQKEKEIEMLKTLPPKLFPYYKKEVSEYFKRIGEVQK